LPLGEKTYLAVVAIVGILGGLAAVAVSLAIGEWACIVPGMCFGGLGVFVGILIVGAQFLRR
jgi:hypothetical protein